MEPFLGEIRLFTWGFAPKGWAFCSGQILSINQNQALFALLGTTYGGNGQTTFALPNLNGKVPIGAGQGLGLPPMDLGQIGGAEAVTLLAANLPQHSHSLHGVSDPATTTNPAGQYPAKAARKIYGAGTNVPLEADAISTTGGNQPHENLQPYLALNYAICLVGVFPSRN